MIASLQSPSRQHDLEAVEIHGVLSNERRQMTLALLEEEGGAMSARELSERIAERETGESPPPRNIRQSAYISLLQTHLPKLDELDVVEYDDSQKTVRLSSGADQLSTFLETESKPSIDRYYLSLSLIGLVLVVVSWVGGLPVDPRWLSSLEGVVFALGTVLAGYRLYFASNS